MTMKYGQIAGNRRLNTLIYRCFEYICEEDERKFIKKFREHPPTSDQLMHTVRELILGSYLCSRDFKAIYDYAIDTQTPDWCILDESFSVKGIVELVNFHIDKVTDNKIEKQRQVKGIAWYWRDGNKDNVDRLYECIQYKAQVYRNLTEELRLPYVIAVFGDFQAAVDFEEVQTCLFDEGAGLFKLYPGVSGLLYFEENSGRYSFRYAHNPNRLRVLDLPDGVFAQDAT